MNGEIMKENISQLIPIMIDDSKNIEGSALTRCVYFSIESDTPSADWGLILRSYSIPFMLIGLSGIITLDLNGYEFKSADDIDKLIDLIEENGNLFVDTNTLWLPSFVFHSKRQRGDICRINSELFIIALNYVNYRMDEIGLFSQSDNSEHKVEYREIETRAFKDWELKHRGIKT